MRKRGRGRPRYSRSGDRRYKGGLVLGIGGRGARKFRFEGAELRNGGFVEEAEDDGEAFFRQ